MLKLGSLLTVEQNNNPSNSWIMRFICRAKDVKIKGAYWIS